MLFPAMVRSEDRPTKPALRTEKTEKEAAGDHAKEKPSGEHASTPKAEPAPPKEPAIHVEEVLVTGRSESLLGHSDAASQGRVSQDQLAPRPVLRVGEVLETVPGLIATQHSGEGKANQYFLRGFNLDHGTDFGTWVEGMPVNEPTHGHGQGYTDLNFMIPELIEHLDFSKGPYKAEDGDFSAAGSARIHYFSSLDQNIAEGEGGTLGHGRAVVAGSTGLKGGDLLGGLELSHHDGPWKDPGNANKINGVLKYSRGSESNGWSIETMGYAGKWNSTDQVAKRAIEAGTSIFDSLDKSDGGKAQRYSLSGEWHRASDKTTSNVSAYAISSSLDLWSNFTYFLDDPDFGDQIHQVDRRVTTGIHGSHTWLGSLNGRAMENTLGLQVRSDTIYDLGLFHTYHRHDLPAFQDDGTGALVRYGTIRDDRVRQTSIAPYYENKVQWLEKMRTVFGVREDTFLFDVKSSTDANSGRVMDQLASPKLSIILGPWSKTEVYLNAGFGYHSNDGRSTTTRVDPKSGESVERGTPLVRVKGAEVGTRTLFIPHLQSTLSLWALDIDSELVFVGDAGTVEAGRSSRRAGIEWANYYAPTKWLSFDLDLSFSTARFTESDPAVSGSHIPGALEWVVASGVSVDHPSGFFGSLRVRYFGPRPLIEGNSIRSSSTTLLNARVGYRFNKRVSLFVEGFNLLNRKDHDITYFYTSRLPGELPEGVDDVHFHPVEPISVRAGLSFRW